MNDKVKGGIIVAIGILCGIILCEILRCKGIL